MWRIFIRLSREFWCKTVSSQTSQLGTLKISCVKTGLFWRGLQLQYTFLKYLKLWHHGDFTEAFAGWAFCSSVSEDLVQQCIVRLLQQAGELQGNWVLQVRHPQVNIGAFAMCLWSTMVVSFSPTHLVLLHHPLYLVVDLASIVGYGEVRLLTELVPAYVGVLAEILLQANPKCLWFGGPIETTFLHEICTSWNSYVN